jgi:hypothetical protein
MSILATLELMIKLLLIKKTHKNCYHYYKNGGRCYDPEYIDPYLGICNHHRFK